MASFDKKQFLVTCPVFIIFSWLALLLHIGPNTNLQSIFVGLFSLIPLLIFVGTLDSILRSPWKYLFRLGLIIIVVLNAENILINGSHIDLSFSKFATNKTFILGTLSNLRLLALLLFFSTFFMLSVVISSKIQIKAPLEFISILGFVLLIGDIFIPEKIQYSSWFQKNIITFNIKNFSYQKFGSKQPDGLSDRLLPKDLEGNLIDNVQIQDQQKPNIILLILEGFSEDYVKKGLTPNLKKFLEENFHVPHFIANQVQTNRGLYAILCNDYPNIGSAEAKADIISTYGPKSPCLPQLLKEQGYNTLFMQSAPLEFMRKDLFAKVSGFDYAAGANSFEPSKMISEWGVSDGTLLEGAVNVLGSEEFTHPIFLTLLTVSTHHPYITPESKNDLVKAITYTDKVFGDFYKLLKYEKYFEKNILIVTSDEARPFREIDSYILGHWGVLGIAGLGIKKGENTELFSQVDLGASIADFLGKANAMPVRGRSVFRHYKTPRNIFAGSAFLKRPIMIEDDKTIHLCDQSFHCLMATYNNTIFDQSEKPTLVPSTKNELIRAFIKNNDLTFDSFNESALFKENNITVRNSKLIIAEFKTPPEMSRLKYHIEISPEDMNSKIFLKYTSYPCGVPEKLSEKSELISSPNQEVPLILPEGQIGKTICHSAIIETRSNSPLKVKRFELLKVSR